MKDVQVVRADDAPADERVKVNDFFPERLAEKNHRHGLVWLLGLNQRQHFKHFVHRAEAAGKDDQRFGRVDEPEFAHEKVMKIKNQIARDVLIDALLERQFNVQADGLAARLGSAAI